MSFTKTIRLFALKFYDVAVIVDEAYIVDEAIGLINYHIIEISSS